MEITNKILVTGATGMVGSSLTKLLRNKGYKNIIAPSHSELDLRRQNDVEDFFASHKPDFVFHFAAQAGVRYSVDNPNAYIDSNIVGFYNIFFTSDINNTM